MSFEGESNSELSVIVPVYQLRKELFCPRTIRDWNALPTDTADSRLTYLIKLIKLFYLHIYFVQHFIVKFNIGMCTKVAVSSVIDGSHKLVEGRSCVQAFDVLSQVCVKDKLVFATFLANHHH